MRNINLSKGLTLNNKSVEVLSAIIRDELMDLDHLEGFAVAVAGEGEQCVCPVYKRPYSSLHSVSISEDGGLVESLEVEAFLDMRYPDANVAFQQAISNPYSTITGFVTVK